MKLVLTTLVVLVSFVASLSAEPRPPRDFDKLWEKDIAAIEQRDEQDKPAKGGVVFVGSSSIRLWDLKKSFPDLAAVNHGFGGSTIADSAHFLDRLVLKLEPKTIVFYSGDNDLKIGLSPEQVHADFEAFAKGVAEKLPHSKIVVIAIKPSPSRVKLFDQQQKANRLIQATIAKDPSRLVYVDVVTPMLGDDGQPRAELFRDDMLHLNDAGYALWNKLLAPHLK